MSRVCSCVIHSHHLMGGVIIHSKVKIKLSENQADFRPGYSTVDHIFTIKNVIDVFLSKKKKIFCAFIDFKKAFDTVWRSGLWSKLLTCGVTGNLLNVIKSIYNNIKSRIVANGAKSNYFSCYTGVRQGENLSQLLFSLFMIWNLFS